MTSADAIHVEKLSADELMAFQADIAKIGYQAALAKLHAGEYDKK